MTTSLDIDLTSPLSVRNSTRPQPLIQQLLQRRSDFRLPLLRSVIDQRLHRPLDQHTQYRVRISTAGASHADRLGENAGGIGSAGSSTLRTPDQVINGWIGSVWHGATLSNSPAVRQAPASPNRVDIPMPSRFQPNVWQNNRCNDILNQEVQRRDLVKEYEFRKDQYLLLNDADFDSVKV